MIYKTGYIALYLKFYGLCKELFFTIDTQDSLYITDTEMLSGILLLYMLPVLSVTNSYKHIKLKRLSSQLSFTLLYILISLKCIKQSEDS